MAKVKVLQNQQGKDSLIVFYCPGCKREHPYNINNENPKHNWEWNGDLEKPSFTPSLRVLDGKGGTECHLYVTDGKICYCNDCPHEYNGRTIDLPDLPEYLGY